MTTPIHSTRLRESATFDRSVIAEIQRAADETALCIPMLDPEQGRRGPRA